MPESWARDAIFYHIYPLGLCGAEPRNDRTFAPKPRLDQLRGWITHLRRLGTDDTLAGLVAALHAGGIRVVLDGVFHHVGRDFWAFRDLRENRERSPFRDWFAGVDFSRRSPYGDPFAYDTWQGHYDLVKL